MVMHIEPESAATIPERSPNAPAPGEQIPTHYRWCFGCGVDHPTGLHMVVTAGQNLNVDGVFTVTEHHQGAPGLAHGGLLSAAIDEVLGSLNWLIAAPAVTGHLACDFKKPVPVGTVLYVHAHIESVHGRKVYTRATAHMNDPEGPIAIEASALFVQVGVEHFMSHGNKREVDAALTDRQSRWGELADKTSGEDQPFEVNP